MKRITNIGQNDINNPIDGNGNMKETKERGCTPQLHTSMTKLCLCHYN